jgi:hypothetical protein
MRQVVVPIAAMCPLCGAVLPRAWNPDDVTCRGCGARCDLSQIPGGEASD